MAIISQKNSGWFFVFGLSILPVTFWLLMEPLSDRFMTFPVAMTSIGQVFGLVGMAMFSCVLILAARFRWLEKYFGGLNKVYQAHHFFGGLSLVLLLIHPVVLSARYLQMSLRDAALFLLPIGDVSIIFGIIALLAMILLLVLTFFAKLRYQVWKWSHKFLGAAFGFAALHALLIRSDVSRSLPLRTYLFVLSALGLAAFLYRVVFGKILVKKFNYTVESVNQIGNKIIEIIMSPKGEAMKYLAGQFIFIKFYGSNINSETHPFSISSGNVSEKLSIAVKASGDYTAQLKYLKAGAVAKVEGPFGQFSYQNSGNKNQLWIAGGIGITPFLGMARSLKSDEFKIDLYYCAKNQEELVFLKEIESMAASFNNFKILPFCSDGQRFISAEIIKKSCADLFKKDIFLCGPPAMMKSLRQQFKNDGHF